MAIGRYGNIDIKSVHEETRLTARGCKKSIGESARLAILRSVLNLSPLLKRFAQASCP